VACNENAHRRETFSLFARWVLSVYHAMHRKPRAWKISKKRLELPRGPPQRNQLSVTKSRACQIPWAIEADDSPLPGRKRLVNM
jgi:hypothetical protein